MNFESKSIVLEQTDFSKMDSLALWSYKLTITDSVKIKRTISSIAIIEFIRTKLTTDTISQPESLRKLLKDTNDSLRLSHFETDLKKDRNKYTRHEVPRIDYVVYKLEDSANIFKDYIGGYFSSCVAPNVGGDYFILGNFIFLNQSVCVSCAGDSPNTDICRPIINYIFSNLSNNISTIQSIIKQFPIKEYKNLQ